MGRLTFQSPAIITNLKSKILWCFTVFGSASKSVSCGLTTSAPGVSRRSVRSCWWRVTETPGCKNCSHLALMRSRPSAAAWCQREKWSKTKASLQVLSWALAQNLFVVPWLHTGSLSTDLQWVKARSYQLSWRSKYQVCRQTLKAESPCFHVRLEQLSCPNPSKWGGELSDF